MDELQELSKEVGRMEERNRILDILLEMRDNGIINAEVSKFVLELNQKINPH